MVKLNARSRGWSVLRRPAASAAARADAGSRQRSKRPDKCTGAPEPEPPALAPAACASDASEEQLYAERLCALGRVEHGAHETHDLLAIDDLAVDGAGLDCAGCRQHDDGNL